MVSTRSIRMSNPRDSILQVPGGSASGSSMAAPEEGSGGARPPAHSDDSPPGSETASTSSVLLPRPLQPASPTPARSTAGGVAKRRSMPVRTAQSGSTAVAKRQRRLTARSSTAGLSPRSGREAHLSDEDDLVEGPEPTAGDLVHVESWDGPMEPTLHYNPVPPGAPPHRPSTYTGPGEEVSPAQPIVSVYHAPSSGSPPSPMRPTTVMRDSGVQTSLPSLNQSVLPEDLKVHLECPVCSKLSLPPIMQCRNGHVTCNSCRPKVSACPVCREVVIDIRNMFAEKALLFMTIPCEYQNFGCKVEVQFRDKDEHERVCVYRPYLCPYIECDHRLAASAVVEHVSTAHREECRRSEGPEITASMILIGMYFGGDGAWSPRVISCFGRTFFDVALTRDRCLHHWVWLLGEEEEAQDFIYEITAFKNHIKYVYGGEVSSLRTSDDDIVSEGQCLSISDAIGRRLRDGDKIRYKLRLMRKPDRQ